jgi:hypothetical protein
MTSTCFTKNDSSVVCTTDYVNSDVKGNSSFATPEDVCKGPQLLGAFTTDTDPDHFPHEMQNGTILTGNYLSIVPSSPFANLNTDCYNEYNVTANVPILGHIVFTNSQWLQTPIYAGLQFLTGTDDILFPQSFKKATPYIPSYTLKNTTIKINQASTDIDQSVPIFHNSNEYGVGIPYFSTAFSSIFTDTNIYKYIDVDNATSCDWNDLSILYDTCIYDKDRLGLLP